MAWRARQRSENRRAGGLKGRDRGWLPEAVNLMLLEFLVV